MFLSIFINPIYLNTISVMQINENNIKAILILWRKFCGKLLTVNDNSQGFRVGVLSKKKAETCLEWLIEWFIQNEPFFSYIQLYHCENKLHSMRRLSCPLCTRSTHLVGFLQCYLSEATVRVQTYCSTRTNYSDSEPIYIYILNRIEDVHPKLVHWWTTFTS
jgi:hypothetical protein